MFVDLSTTLYLILIIWFYFCRYNIFAS